MFTVNIEHSLIKENKKLITPKELLLITEYEKFSPFVESDVLHRHPFGAATGRNHGENLVALDHLTYFPAFRNSSFTCAMVQSP
mgnify:CR=1 FL=1